jgi:hypothetical protein
LTKILLSTRSHNRRRHRHNDPLSLCRIERHSIEYEVWRATSRGLGCTSRSQNAYHARSSPCGPASPIYSVAAASSTLQNNHDGCDACRRALESAFHGTFLESVGFSNKGQRHDQHPSDTDIQDHRHVLYEIRDACFSAAPVLEEVMITFRYGNTSDAALTSTPMTATPARQIDPAIPTDLVEAPYFLQQRDDLWSANLLTASCLQPRVCSLVFAASRVDNRLDYLVLIRLVDYAGFYERTLSLYVCVCVCVCVCGPTGSHWDPNYFLLPMLPVEHHRFLLEPGSDGKRKCTKSLKKLNRPFLPSHGPEPTVLQTGVEELNSVCLAQVA